MYIIMKKQEENSLLLNIDPCKVYMRLDKYTSRICTPMISRYCLTERYYHRAYVGLDYTMFVLFPLQKLFGCINIVKNKLKPKEYLILKDFILFKSTKWTNVSQFKDWPDVFSMIETDDNQSSLRDKRDAVQSCIDVNVSFLEKRMYCNKLNEIDLEILTPKLEFLTNLHIIMARDFIDT